MTSKSGCIVITGSSKGIGLGLAHAFLEQQQAVVISSRNSTDLHSALQQLRHCFPTAQIYAVTCDVTQIHEVQTLWDEAVQQFGAVQIWINNAGSCTATLDFKDLAAADIQTVVQTNILGSMFGSQVALNGMLAQGYGQIFNSRHTQPRNGSNRSTGILLAKWQCATLEQNEKAILFYY